jgi:hypothetical protein
MQYFVRLSKNLYAFEYSTQCPVVIIITDQHAHAGKVLGPAGPSPPDGATAWPFCGCHLS